MNFDQCGLAYLIAMTLFSLTVTVSNLIKVGNKNKNFMPVVFILSSVAYIVFYAHLIGVVGK